MDAKILTALYTISLGFGVRDAVVYGFDTFCGQPVTSKVYRVYASSPDGEAWEHYHDFNCEADAWALAEKMGAASDRLTPSHLDRSEYWGDRFAV